MARKQANNNKKKTKPTLPRPLWYTILIGAVLALACALFLMIRWSLNTYYVSEAKKGRYHYGIEKTLSTFNRPDGYVVWYNIGNYHFSQGDFEEAEADYCRALESGIPYEKECPVKVNLALSMIEQLSDEEWDAFFESNGSDEMSAEARKVEKALVTARTILVEDGCAHEDDEDGHYEPAQILKDEIDELLQNDDSENEDDEDEDQDNDDSDSDDNNNDGQGDGDDQNQSSREDQIMEHIQDQKEEAQEERADDQQFYENYYGFGDDEGGGGSGGDGGSAEDSGEIW